MGLQNDDMNELNRYILEETDFVEEALGSVQGLYGEDWSIYDVVKSVESVDSYSKLSILEETVESNTTLDDLWNRIKEKDGKNISGEELRTLQENKLITKGDAYTVSGTILSTAYLSYLNRVESDKI